MSRPKDERQKELFRPALEAIIDMRHPLVLLAGAMDWDFLERSLGDVYRPGPRQPPLPVRLMAGLMILKYMHGLSDEALCARWLENPYFQYFCGEETFRHEPPFDRWSLTRWRQRLGEEPLAALIQESLAVAHKTGALSNKDLERVAVDTTVQSKAIAHPTDARLLHTAIVKLAALARENGVTLRQSYVRVAPDPCVSYHPLRCDKLEAINDWRVQNPTRDHRKLTLIGRSVGQYWFAISEVVLHNCPGLPTT